jgi:hypothetical protein
MRNSVTVSPDRRPSGTCAARDRCEACRVRERARASSSWQCHRGPGRAQHRLHALDTRRARTALQCNRRHPFQAEQFVDFLVLRGQEKMPACRQLTDAAQKLHAIHARHLDIEDPRSTVHRSGLPELARIAVVRKRVAFASKAMLKDVECFVRHSTRATVLFSFIVFRP